MRYGIRVGVLASLVLPSITSAAIVQNAGFESAQPTQFGDPVMTGQWQGDITTRVGADRGLVPSEGSWMVRFDSTTTSTTASSLTASNLSQDVRLDAFTPAIQGGAVSVTLSAQFNRILGNAQSDAEFDLRVIAKSNSADLADTGFVPFITDANPATWQTFFLPLLLPAGTTHLQIEVAAVENVFDNTSGTLTEFDGHYVDNVVLNIVPEPGSPALVGSASAALLMRCRRNPCRRRVLLA